MNIDKPHSLIAIVPAAGVGSRMKTERPKQYLSIAGKTVLEHTVERLLSLAEVNQIIIAISADDPYFHQMSLASDSRVHVVEGGAERAITVQNGLIRAKQLGFEWALVHDAARPCVRRTDMATLIDTVFHDTERQGGLLAMPVRDTMKRTDGGNKVVQTEPRDNLWHALTPQLFPVEPLLGAITAALEANFPVTDEASAMEFQGFSPRLVEGHSDNIKITRPADLPLAAFFLKESTVL